MSYAPGLIRYATENGVANGWTRRQMLRRVLRPRVLVYGAVLAATGVAFVASLALRSDFRVDVIKDRGMLARVLDDGGIENVYRLQIVNSSEEARHYSVGVTGLPGLRIASAPVVVTVAAVGIGLVPVRVTLAPEAAEEVRGRASSIVFEVAARAADADAAQSVRAQSTFFVPR